MYYYIKPISKITAYNYIINNYVYVRTVKAIGKKSIQGLLLLMHNQAYKNGPRTQR